MDVAFKDLHGEKVEFHGMHFMHTDMPLFTNSFGDPSEQTNF